LVPAASPNAEPSLDPTPDRALGVARVVAAVEPFDEVERPQQAGVLAWLDSTPEFGWGRWWTGQQIGSSRPELFDPEHGPLLAKIRVTLG
jgi:hypothetical protein